jgi:hypothetical protein
MNRSFSKIRHIQEANLKLEKRLIKEETDELRDDRLQKIIDMDQELDNDPTYQRYEKLYSKKRIADMIKDQMGMDLDEMAAEDNELELVSKLRDYNKLIQDYN